VVVASGFKRLKAHRRIKLSEHRHQSEDLRPEVVADEDALIPAGSICNVSIRGPFEGRDDWLVDRLILPTDDGSVVSAPMTWVNSENAYLPIANPGVRPWYVRKGEMIGRLVDPASFADVPANNEEREHMAANAESIRSTIGTLRQQDLAAAELSEKPPHEDDHLEGDDQWGPKTTAVPEDVLPDVDVSSLVNWGPDIPADIKPRLEEVL
jgi:hypothetical protein